MEEKNPPRVAHVNVDRVPCPTRPTAPIHPFPTATGALDRSISLLDVNGSFSNGPNIARRCLIALIRFDVAKVTIDGAEMPFFSCGYSSQRAFG